MQKSKAKKQKPNKKDSLLPFFLWFCLKLYGMLPSSLCCPEHFSHAQGLDFFDLRIQRWIPTNGWPCLGWSCGPEDSVTLLQWSCVLALDFLGPFWERHTCIRHGTHVGYSLGPREALLRAFPEAPSWIKGKIQVFILNVQQRKMGQGQCSWGILGISRAAQNSESKTHKKGNQWFWLCKDLGSTYPLWIKVIVGWQNGRKHEMCKTENKLEWKPTRNKTAVSTWNEAKDVNWWKQKEKKRKPRKLVCLYRETKKYWLLQKFKLIIPHHLTVWDKQN